MGLIEDMTEDAISSLDADGKSGFSVFVVNIEKADILKAQKTNSRLLRDYLGNHGPLEIFPSNNHFRHFQWPMNSSYLSDVVE